MHIISQFAFTGRKRIVRLFTVIMEICHPVGTHNTLLTAIVKAQLERFTNAMSTYKDSAKKMSMVIAEIISCKFTLSDVL